MDFITKLPKSKEPMTKVTYDSILMETCKLTKEAYLIPYMEASNAKELAYAFLKNFVSKHGMPSKIITDRDKLFTSKFWKSLMKQMGGEQKMITAFHPQANGQTERMNQTIEQYLRYYVNFQQDNWVELLPMAEFIFNSIEGSTTGVTPFYANKGYNPVAYGEPIKGELENPEAKERAKQLKEIQT